MESNIKVFHDESKVNEFVKKEESLVLINEKLQ
jgi:hypothetical protein